MQLIDTVYQAVLPEMAAKGIEDTTENRIYFLTGLLEAWTENDDSCIEKSCYVIAVSLEISHLQIKQHLNLTTGQGAQT